jgi:hypothetical protein
VNQTEGEVYPGVNVTGEALERYVHAHNPPNSWVGSYEDSLSDDPLVVVDEEPVSFEASRVFGLLIGRYSFVPNGIHKYRIRW